MGVGSGRISTATIVMVRAPIPLRTHSKYERRRERNKNERDASGGQDRRVGLLLPLFCWVFALDFVHSLVV